MSLAEDTVVTGRVGGPGSRVWQSLARIARQEPERVAVEEFGPEGRSDRWTYGRLWSRADEIVRTLDARTDRGDAVLLDGEGGGLQIAWTLAAVRAGLWVLPVPMQTTPTELDALCESLGARLIIGPRERSGARGPSAEWMDWSADHGAARGVAVEREPGGVVLVTSGTTGGKKLVMRDAASLDADGANVFVAASLVATDRVLLAISLSHSYALDMILGSVLAGASMQTVPTFDIPAVVGRLAGGATVFPGVPFLFEGLTPRWEGAGDLRLVFSAGSRLPCTTRRAFTEATGLPIGDLYGATELGTVVFRDPARGDAEPGLIGEPLPGVSVRVLDPASGRVLNAGEEGELAVRSPSMLRGYVHAPATLVNGYFPTGDLARVDERGRVFLTGRTKFVIESGGLKLNPVELESVIESHPGVRECLVVPVPASETITRIRALVVAESGSEAPTASALRAYLRNRVGPAKIPRQFEFVASLPRSATGKLLRPSTARGHG